MKRKLNEKELNNVSGGGCRKDSYYYDHFLLKLEWCL